MAEIPEAKNICQKIINSNQVLNMCKELNEFRKSGMLCNFQIILLDKTSYSVHKSVLAAGCPYFKSLFNYENVNKTMEVIPIEISGKIFEKILEFIYTGETEIELKDALDLHTHAIYFMLNTLKDNVCTNFLINNIQIDTCLIYWRGSVLDKTLKEKCEEFIAKNTEGFLDKYLYELNDSELNKILSIKTLICPEEKLYLFVIKWLKKDYKKRKNKFPELLKMLRFCSLSDNGKVKLINECSEIHHSLKVLAKHFKKNTRNDDQSIKFTDNSLTPRIGSLTQNLFGLSTTRITKFNNAQGFINCLDITRIAGFKTNNFGENYLLLSGGQNTKICEYFCPIRNILKPFPDMLEARSCHGILTMNDIIFAGGGCNSGITTEQFDLNLGKWSKGPDLNNPRRNYDLIFFNNSIYAFGGGSKIIERFDSRENKWNTLSTNYEYTGGTRSLIIDNSIYCFSTKKIDIFDIRQEKWISNLPIPLIFSGCTVNLLTLEIIYFNNYINMIGHCVRNPYLNNYSPYLFYKYNINNNTWSYQNNTAMQYSLATLYT